MSGLLDSFAGFDTEDVGEAYRGVSRVRDEIDAIDSTFEAGGDYIEAQGSGGPLEQLDATFGGMAELGTVGSRTTSEIALDAALDDPSETADNIGETADEAFWERTPLDAESELLLPDSVQHFFADEEGNPAEPTIGDAASVMVAEPIDSLSRAATGERVFDPEDRGDSRFRGIEAFDLAMAPFSYAVSGGAAASRALSSAASGGSNMPVRGLTRGASRAFDSDTATSIARMDFEDFSSVSTRAGVDDTFTRGTSTAQESAFDAGGGLQRVMDELPSSRQTGTDLGSLRAGDDVPSPGGATSGSGFDDIMGSVSRTVDDAVDDVQTGAARLGSPRESADGTTSLFRQASESSDEVGRFTARASDDAGATRGFLETAGGRFPEGSLRMAEDTTSRGLDAATGAVRSVEDAASGAARTGSEGVGIGGRISNGVSRVSSTIGSAFGRVTTSIRNNPIMAALGLGTAGYLAASEAFDGGAVPLTSSDGPYLYELVAEPSVRRENPETGEEVVVPGLIFRITRGEEELGFTVFVNETSVLSADGQVRTANMSLMDLSQSEGSVEEDSTSFTPLEPIFDTLSEARRVFMEWAEGNTAPEETFEGDDGSPTPDGDDDSPGGGWGNAEIMEELGAGWYLARQRHTENQEERFSVIGRTDGGDTIFLDSRGQASESPTHFDTPEEAVEAFRRWAERARSGQTEGEPTPSENAGRPTSEDAQDGMGAGGGGVVGQAAQAAASNSRALLYGGVVAFVAIYYISDGEPISWTADKLPIVGE